MLYVLVAETLGRSISASNNVKGFLVPGSGGTTTRISQYADDATLLLRDLTSVRHVLSIVDIYGKGTGARLNRTKSEAMWLGSWKSRSDTPLGLKWVTKMRVLGVWFGENVYYDNWRSRVDKLETVLNLWKSRALSIWGRVLIVKTFALSKLDYIARILLVPNEIVTAVNKLIWNFVWRGKNELICRATCLLPRDQGGVAMIDYECRVKALQVKNVLSSLTSKNTNAFHFARYFVGNRVASLIDEFSGMRTNLLPSCSVLPKYYDTFISFLREHPLVIKPDMSVKALYLKLVEKKVVIPKCFSTITLRTGLTNLRCVWSTFLKSQTEPRVREIRWRAVHGVTMTRLKLWEWNCKGVNKGCAICNLPESIEHCFLECKRARRAWGWVVFLLKGISHSSFKIDYDNILLCLFYKNSHKDQLMVFVIETMLNSIWFFRNRANFDNNIVSFQYIIRKCKHDISNRILVDKQRLSRALFNTTWDIENFLTKITCK